MPDAGPPRRPTAAGKKNPPLRRPRTAAFSLVELAVVVLIISLLAAIAVPAFKRVTIRARSAAVANDLRVFAAAFQVYVHEHGDWPPGDGTPGAFPAGLEGALGATAWARPTPIGGRYTWAPNSTQQGARCRAVIVLSTDGANAVSSDRFQLLDLDRQFDDRDLTTGSLRLGFRNYPVYVLEQ